MGEQGGPFVPIRQNISSGSGGQIIDRKSFSQNIMAEIPSGCCGDASKTFGLSSFIDAKMSGKVEESIANSRMSTCMKCQELSKHKLPFKNNIRLFRIIENIRYCGEPWIDRPYRNVRNEGCGCNLDDKVQWKDAECPRGKWGKASDAPAELEASSREMPPVTISQRDMPRTPNYFATPNFDLYMMIGSGGPVCYWNNTPVTTGSGTATLTADYLSTANAEAYSGCVSYQNVMNSPKPGAIINGSFTGPQDYWVWHAQNDACSVQQSPDIALVIVTNIGASNITVNGNTVTPGNTFTISPIVDASFSAHDQSAFGTSGTLVSIGDPSICWVLTAKRKNGRFYRTHGPGRYPTKIEVPSDVELRTVQLVEDGKWVSPRKYKVTRATRQ